MQAEKSGRLLLKGTEAVSKWTICTLKVPKSPASCRECLLTRLYLNQNKDQTIYSWEPFSKVTDRLKHNGWTSVELTVYGVAAVSREERMKRGKANTRIKTKWAILKEDSCADRMEGVRTYSFLHGRKNNPCSRTAGWEGAAVDSNPKARQYVCLPPHVAAPEAEFQDSKA